MKNINALKIIMIIKIILAINPKIESAYNPLLRLIDPKTIPVINNSKYTIEHISMI